VSWGYGIVKSPDDLGDQLVIEYLAPKARQNSTTRGICSILGLISTSESGRLRQVVCHLANVTASFNSGPMDVQRRALADAHRLVAGLAARGSARAGARPH